MKRLLPWILLAAVCLLAAVLMLLKIDGVPLPQLLAKVLQGEQPDSGIGPLRLPVQFILLSLGTLVSEDLSCIAGGLLSASGSMPYGLAVLACFTGILVGDSLIYGLGYAYGRPLLRHRRARWVFSVQAVEKAEDLFRRRGIWIVFLTRLIPGTRTATYFTAGMLHAPPLRFIPAFVLAAALWTPFLVGVSHLVGARLIALYGVYEAVALPVLAAAALLLYLLIHYGLPLFSWKGRRRLRGRWMRAVRWEFWPVWQVNWLVFLYVLGLGILRYRHLTAFTAVNPCMPHGGFLGESKSDILARLAGIGEALPAWTRIAEGDLPDRLAAFRDGIRELGLSYPVVLKPDDGQRGLGVAVVRSEAEAAGWFTAVPVAAILQEAVGGCEFGIFHVRHPDESEGRITSVTIKRPLEVLGNGTDDLETLIHRHPRAIAQLDVFLHRFAARLHTVPAAGQRVPLGELGTHALGSLFLDGAHLATPALRQRIDQLARACPGFHFGRFDIRAPDEQALREGRALRVLELNGLTSEATHIYDPRHGLLHAWRVLCGHWREAFEIGRAHVSRGYPASSPRELLKDYRAARRRQRTIGPLPPLR